MTSEIDRIQELARQRLSRVFACNPATTLLTAVFGEDLRASSVSDFRRNELDRVLDDIRDASDRKRLADISDGRVVIRTVQDYCDHMVICDRTNPRKVEEILARPGNK